MIEKLIIKNFLVIDNIEINFDKGLNIFTGETGAGKSVIVESINFLLGSKIYKSSVKGNSEVKAVFNLDKKTADKFSFKDRIEIKRTVDFSKRSKYFINGNPVSLNLIKEISPYLVDFHAQLENNVLLSSAKQIEFLDKYCGIEKDVKEFAEYYRKKNEIESQMKNLQLSEEEKNRMIDLYEYQIKEIEEADLKEGEDFEIEEIIYKYKNLQKIKNILSKLADKISGEEAVENAIYDIHSKISDLKEYDESFFPLYEKIEMIKKEFALFSEEFKDIYSKYGISDEDIDRIIERHELIKKLKRKYGETISDILEKYKSLKKELENLKNLEYSMVELERELNKLAELMRKKAEYLHNVREKKAKKLSKELEKEISKLGFNYLNFEIDVSFNEENFNPHGCDEVEFLFTANPDFPVKPLRYIASGGELSRVMLAIKSVLSRYEDTDTLVFDEIDSGTGGNVAFTVGEMLKKISTNKQVISITHMPQVAVYADKHFKIEKNIENSKTKISAVELKTKSDIINEIARMFGSAYSPDTAKKHAKEIFDKIKK